MMNGLFAYRDIEVGEILVQYTGPILTQKQANASSSDYLFDVFYRSREGADTVVRKTIDGRGELAGYANHAPEHLANASAVDLMPSIIDNNVYYQGRHALVFVAKSKIKRGTEIRFNYNSDQSNDSGQILRMMKNVESPRSKSIIETFCLNVTSLRLSTIGRVWWSLIFHIAL